MSTATAVPTRPTGASAVPEKLPRKIRWGTVGTVAMMVVIILWCLAPFYWMLVLSFRDTNFTFDTTPWFSHFTFSNFKYAFNADFNPFGRSLLNSIIIGGTVTLVSMVIGVFAGYALARL